MVSSRILASIFVAGLMFVMWQQYKQLGLQQTVIEMQQSNTQKLEDHLKDLVEQQTESANQVTELMFSQQNIQQNLSARNADIRRMQNDIKEIRDWANVPLPDAIIRMRSRPTITGTKAYGEAVSTSGAMRSDSGQSAE